MSRTYRKLPIETGTTNSFNTIQTDSGTSPTATSGADTLTLTSPDSSILINGNDGTDTIDFTVNINGMALGSVNASDEVMFYDYATSSNKKVTVSALAGAVGLPAEFELDVAWSTAAPLPFKEFIYNLTGDIVDFNVYVDNTKTIQVFNKHFNYNLAGNLIQVVTTNLLTSQVKTKDITYNITGEMESTTES